LAFGAILTVVSPAAGVIVAGLGLAFELVLFVVSATGQP
jgi:hypothetical protein